jgi:hypothetical protein
MFNPTLYGVDYNQSAAAEAARQLIHSKIQIGESQKQYLIKHCASNIPRDRYVSPGAMRFVYKSDYGRHLVLFCGNDKQHVTIHPHALGQLADTSGISRSYVGRLHVGEHWREELLAHNLNTLFKEQTFLNRAKQPAEFLHRLVGNELRGFLTQSYNRHLLSAPLLMAFLEACQEVNAQPVSASATATKVGLQCYLPWAFEPIRGEFIAIGVWWGNSDFGDGKLKVSHSIMRVSGFGSIIVEEGFSRVHLSGVVKDSDLRLSDEVAQKEIDTVAAAIKDAVHQVLQPEPIQRLLAVIAKAHEEEIPWDRLKGQLGKLLAKKHIEKLGELLDQKVTDLPPPGMDSRGQPLASRWWAAAAVAMLAEHETNVDERVELKQLAGKLIGGIRE